jgi:hypothetical protein
VSSATDDTGVVARQDGRVTTDLDGDLLWPDLATLSCRLHPADVIASLVAELDEAVTRLEGLR